mmetsp:Transcript_18246/g.20791  ORF Transcript_18246/g.20791 Transcript_18246/m.20791 type:complete len:637 (+) Transcript_18246:70-1980(+)
MNNNSLLSQAAIELEEAVHQILSFQQHQHQQHSHHHQYSRRNRNHVRRSSSSNSCLNAYERTRMVRRVQRSLVALENVLLSESANDEDDQHDDNVDDNVVHIDDHDDDHIDDHDDVLIIDGHIDGHIHNEYQQHQHRQYYDDDYDQIQYDPQPTTTTTTHSPTNDEDHHHQNGNDSIENNKKKKNITLDDSLLHLLIDILTELPKKVTFSSSSSASSSSASSSTISTVSTSSSSTSIFIINDDLYQTISETTCRIIQQYAPLPLHTIHIDKLLDRLANIIIGRSSCSSSSQKKDVVSMAQNLNIIQIMNTSLLAQDGLNQQQHQQQQQQKQQQDDIDDDDDDNDDDDTNINKGSSKSKEAIDLHYDKDEELASAFDIGCFPTLSTVTYLTDSIYSHNGDGTYNSASPTLVFSHIHEMINHGPIGKTMRQTENDEDENNPQLIICHAREGKHLVFDGRLLHGAPSNPRLKQKVHADNNSTTSISIEDNKGLRVTFLVNIWLTRRPSRVFALPEKIRSAVKDSVSNPPTAHDYSGIQALEMIRKEVKKIRVTSRSSDDTKESRIKLPFVSNDATDGEYSDPDDIDDASCLIVSMVPPPKYDASDDTILVCYDKASVPCLEYTMEGESQDEYEEEELNL